MFKCVTLAIEFGNASFTIFLPLTNLFMVPLLIPSCFSAAYMLLPKQDLFLIMSININSLHTFPISMIFSRK